MVRAATAVQATAHALDALPPARRDGSRRPATDAPVAEPS
jgi:hypothetical protein